MHAASVLTISVLLTASAAAAESPRTLCEAGERVYFSCVTESRGRVVSLCGSETLTEAASYLQYRFGRPGAIELEFPSTREGSIGRFRYSHYVRPLVDRQDVSFDTGGHRYAVLHHYEAETQPEEVYAGVEVSKQAGGAASRDLPCKASVTSELIALEDVVPCDPANALGSCAE
jgi:hypothetical protein